MRSGASWLNRTILVVGMVLSLAPMWFLFVGSLQDIHGSLAMPPKLLPTQPKLEHYAFMVTQPKFGRWIVNSVVTVVVTVVGSVVVSCGAAYVFAFYRFPLKKAAWVVLLSSILVPRISLIIPQFVVLQRLGLQGTLWAAILPLLLQPVGMFLARNYFETVPRSLLESARLDGASEVRILRQVVMPLAVPILTCLAVFVAVAALGDYLWQMLQLQRPEVMTMLVGITRAGAKRGGDIGVVPLGRQMAGAVLLLAPLLAVFLAANKYFVGALGGAIKE